MSALSAQAAASPLHDAVANEAGAKTPGTNAPADGPLATLVLSLVSHTNAGKTTLARTLLGRDVGEVRDAPHVTEFADGFSLAETPEGDRLEVWDTPGFGDSARLARRLMQAESPLGWLLSQVWDRLRDRPFWATQQALRHVRERSDVVLYLVNAAESPAAAGYIAPEMALLQWLGKPVLVLLNQLGASGSDSLAADEIARWRAHLAVHPQVRAVLPLDAFTRCWVQEGMLWQAVQAVLPADQQGAMARLRQAWMQPRLEAFDASMAALAGSLGRIAAARAEGGETPGLLERLRRLDPRSRLAERARAAAASVAGAPSRADEDPAQTALALLLDEEIRRCTGELIALHGLAGRAEGEILARLAGAVEAHEPVPEGRAALWGGAVSGALVGLKADLASGGLTLGGGLLAGGVLGALGAAGLARAFNVLRDADRRWLRFSDAALGPRVQAALLRYLAVAHFGRGRGPWAAGEPPPAWRDAVAAELAAREPALAALWGSRSARWDNAGDAERIAAELQPLLAAVTRGVLQRLYPQASTLVFAGDVPRGGAGPAERIETLAAASTGPSVSPEYPAPAAAGERAPAASGAAAAASPAPAATPGVHTATHNPLP